MASHGIAACVAHLCNITLRSNKTKLLQYTNSPVGEMERLEECPEQEIFW